MLRTVGDGAPSRSVSTSAEPFAAPVLPSLVVRRVGWDAMEPTAHTADLAAAADADSSESITSGQETDLLADELLVEEISIDGMCGVY